MYKPAPSLGWLQPLLARIQDNSTAVPSPVIDSVDQTTMRMTHSGSKPSSMFMGAFLWDLYFMWFSQPKKMPHGPGLRLIVSKHFPLEDSRPIA